MFERNARIAIIGAGAAGLSAASCLRDAGFSNITLYEREGRPGGKCETWTHGGASFELGAVLGTDDYEATLGLMARVGLPPDRFRQKKRFRGPDPAGCAFPPGWVRMDKTVPDYIKPLEVPLIVLQILSYALRARRWKGAWLPGNADFPPDLSASYQSWLERHRLELMGKAVKIPFTTFGYGYYESVPAAYAVKYIDPGIAWSLANQRRMFYWKDGVQSLWERLAATERVLYRSRIERIERPERGGVVISANGQTENYEALIVTSPLDELGRFMELDGEEVDLFARIITMDYRVYTLKADGFSKRAGFIPRTFERDEGMGRMMIWDRRDWAQDIYTVYVLGDWRIDDARVRRSIETDFEAAGASVTKWLECRLWKYFPHVTGRDIAAGWYRRAEALQGRRSTYYAGEVMSFSTIEHVARYSRDLVKRFFA